MFQYLNLNKGLEEMPKSSGKKLSNFGDQHKILVRRSKTSNFLALKEEEIEKCIINHLFLLLFHLFSNNNSFRNKS